MPWNAMVFFLMNELQIETINAIKCTKWTKVGIPKSNKHPLFNYCQFYVAVARPQDNDVSFNDSLVLAKGAVLGRHIWERKKATFKKQ